MVRSPRTKVNQAKRTTSPAPSRQNDNATGAIRAAPHRRGSSFYGRSGWPLAGRAGSDLARCDRVQHDGWDSRSKGLHFFQDLTDLPVLSLHVFLDLEGGVEDRVGVLVGGLHARRRQRFARSGRR